MLTKNVNDTLDATTLRTEMTCESLPVESDFRVREDWVFADSTIEGVPALIGYNSRKIVYSVHIAGSGRCKGNELHYAIRSAVKKLGIYQEQQAAANALIAQFEPYRIKESTYDWKAQIPLTDKLYIHAYMGYVEKIQSGNDPNTSISISLYGTADNAELAEYYNTIFAGTSYPCDGSRNVPCGAIGKSPKYPHEKWAVLQAVIDQVKAGDLTGFYQTGYTNRSISIRGGENVTNFSTVNTSLNPQDIELRRIIKRQLSEAVNV